MNTQQPTASCEERLSQPQSSAQIITIENLCFRWQKKLPPLLNIPVFSVNKGERLFLHGASGSGKSTLLGILTGVISPQQGNVSVLGTDIAALPSSARDRFRADHFGVIFQQFNLIPGLSMVDNVALPCRFSELRSKRAESESTTVRQEAKRLLAKLELSSEIIKQPVAQLSVGQQQRVAAARALIGRPEIIIADEPTSALDSDRREAFLSLLFAECKASDSTLIFVCHDTTLTPLFDRSAAIAEMHQEEERQEVKR